MIQNIEILIKIKGLIKNYYFLLDDILAVSNMEDEPLDEMIANADEDVIELLNLIIDIDKLLNALTEDLRDSIGNEGFDCNDYSTWAMRLVYDPMSFDGLHETFTEALKHLELYIQETIRGYRILTQPAYKQESLQDFLARKTFERGTE